MAIMSLRDYANQKGLSVNYNPNSQNVMVGDKDYTKQQLGQMGGKLVNGTWQFDQQSLGKFGPQDNPQLQQPTQVQQPQTVMSATPQVQAPPVDQMATLLAQLKAAQQAQATEQYNRAFESARSGIQAQEQALVPKYQDIARQQQAQDTMARQAQLNQLQMGGLADSGARNQGDIAQNVITQGAMSSANLQQAAERANLARMLQEAQSARDYGIASAGNEANLAQLQAQIGRAGQLEERAIADTRYNQGIARDDAALASNLADRERNRQLETIGQYSSDYQAQINKLQSDADPSNDWLVPYLAQARGEKIAGIEAGKARAEQTNYERALAEQKRQDAINAAALKAAADKAKLDAELKIKQQTANKPKVTKPAAQPLW